MEKKLLIVDDEKSICESLGGFFRRRGYDVSIANGGNDALAIIRTTFFPVMLIDVKMPDLYGTEVLKEAVKIHPTSKIIMMTGFGEDDREACVKMGAYGYVPKPMSLKGVYEMIDKIVTSA